MTDPGQFESNKPPAGNAPSGPLDCAAVELLLTEFTEKTLLAAVAQQVRVHAAGCAACQEKLAQANRGHEWLLVLKQESIEPPVNLVAKILAKTSLANATDHPSAQIRKVLDFSRSDATPAGAIHQRATGEAGYIPQTSAIPASSSVPAWQRNSVGVLRRTLMEPRLALVAAMAFFSISLTLNLMGVRLTNLHSADLTPHGLHRAVTRGYAETNAHVVRYYENLRIVYEVEARVQQLRRAAETSAPVEQEVKPRKQSSDSGPGPGGDASAGQTDSQRQRMAANPGTHGNKHPVQSYTFPNPRPVITGPQMDAVFRPPIQPPFSITRSVDGIGSHTLATSHRMLFETKLALQFAPLASSCPLRTVCFSKHYFSSRERRLA